ncbi:MAG: acyl-CoA reductase [Microscillaceae bacterium]|nr:acyl-CoA reductase [Microscillaceae bacterium]
MNLTQKIKAASELHQVLSDMHQPEWQATLRTAELENKWFSQEYIRAALEGIRLFLEEEQIRQWLSQYTNYSIPVKNPQKVGVIMAGNIPLVGFQDFWHVLMSGHILLAKMSSQDTVLLKKIAQILCDIEPEFQKQIHFVDLLKEADAYIATGSNNSARYFEYYFAKKPHIIRKNRASLGILKGDESESELKTLSRDVFMYFGMGCRNISKLYLPEGYNLEILQRAFQQWDCLVNHNKYGNNYDYNKSILLMNQEPFFDTGFLILQENARLVSPVAMMYYEFYKNQEDLYNKIQLHQDQTQLLTSAQGWFPGSIPFGQSQKPKLWDYADGIDTFKFLLEL